MNKTILLLFLTLSIKNVTAQKLSGQWKGEFIDKSSSSGSLSGDKCDYVLELDVNKNKVSGASYTYFTQNGKNYYTICKVEGEIDFKKKYVEVRETERTKTNIPANIHNCLQVHKLTYFKQGNIETLEGNWVPSLNQEGSCGYGNTSLTRRSLVNSYPSSIAANNKKTNPSKSTMDSKMKPITTQIKPKINTKSSQKEIASNLNNLPKVDDEVKYRSDLPSSPSSEKKESEIETASKLDKRKNTILKTIEVENKIVKVDLYDNGEVDGDSVSLFYNGKLLLANKRLTTKPISLTLNIDEEDSVNELAMYAENLGTIAPNTALMIVTDGPNRYEIRITSDLEKSGVIRFIHKAPK
jgi:hypothetical protein